MNKNKYDPNNDTRLAEYLECEPKTIYETKLKKPKIYKALKKGWTIKCENPTVKVDTGFSSLLGKYLAEKRYELFWLSIHGGKNESKDI